MPAGKAWCIGAAILAALATAAQVPAQQQQKTPPPGAFVLGASPAPAAPAPPKVTPAAKRLPDPSPAEIQHIIQVFATKEQLFRQLLQHNYVYSESIVVQEMNGDDQPAGGTYQQVNEINYDPSSGARQIVCTYCPVPTLQDITITEEDITDMFNMNMYTIPIDELPQYNVTYVDHEPLDQVTVYVFSVTPRQIVKGHRYFSGRVYVDDRDLMIVKSDGRVVPNEYDKHGNPTNTFLPFQVWRQEVDGKYWFPVYTLMQGVVPGQDGAPGIPMRMIIQFKNYKQFHATARILSVQALPNNGNGSQPGATPPAAAKPAKPAAPTIPH